MKKLRFLSLIMAIMVAVPCVLGIVGCGGDGDTDPEYTITYTGIDGASFEGTNPSVYKASSEDIILINPTKAGWDFLGWTGSGISTPSKNVKIAKGTKGNKNYTAIWELTSYSITLNDVDGASFANANPTTYKVNDPDLTLVNPTKPDYDFMGWTGTGLTEATLNVVIPTGSTGDKTYTATWSPTNYNITYYGLDGAELATANPATYNIESSAITLNNPTKTGYDFAGWTGTGLSEATINVTIPTGSTGARYYTATWQQQAPAKVYYNITLNGDDGANYSTNNPATYSSAMTGNITLVNPTKDGATFAGWTGTGLDGLTETVVIEAGSIGTREYTAHWRYDISYTTNGGSVQTANPVTYTDLDTITLNNPIKTGYDFAGWTGTGLNEATINVTIPVGSSGDRTYTATWSAKVYNIVYGGVDGATNSNPTTYTIETDTITLADPVKEGFIFLGWATTGVTTPTKGLTIAQGSTGSKTFTAHWQEEAKEYNITYVFKTDFGTIDAAKITNFDKLPKKYTAGQTLEIPAPLHTNNNNYMFEFWTAEFISGTKTTLVIAATQTGDLTITANFGYFTNNY